MFIDRTNIFIKAGDGGDGIVSFHREKYIAFGGPDGGDGGNGGSVYFAVKNDMSSLMDYKLSKHFRAENGKNGGPDFCRGKNGKDLIIYLPQGTVIKDKETGRIIADMFHKDDKVLVLKGGLGGKGNARFKTAVRKAPHFSQSGEKVKEREVLLELKTIADVGLVGFPNVGKSTLLSVLTNAKPKIANYHFTTLSPNIGIIKYYDDSMVIADIPGLIEGASQGAGLGTDFLRHIERVRLIVHVIDLSGSEGRNPYDDYLKINEELKNYSEKLASLPMMVCANKCDLMEDFEKAVKDFSEKTGKEVIPVSAATVKGIKELKDEIYKELKKLPPLAPEEFEPFSYEDESEEYYEILRDDDGSFIIVGSLIDKLARNIVLSDYESFAHFQKVLKDKGVIKALYKQGAKNGDTVKIEDIEFELLD